MKSRNKDIMVKCQVKFYCPHCGSGKIKKNGIKKTGKQHFFIARAAINNFNALDISVVTVIVILRI